MTVGICVNVKRIVKIRIELQHQPISVTEVQLLLWRLSGNFLQKAPP